MEVLHEDGDNRDRGPQKYERHVQPMNGQDRAKQTEVLRVEFLRPKPGKNKSVTQLLCNSLQRVKDKPTKSNESLFKTAGFGKKFHNWHLKVNFD